MRLLLAVAALLASSVVARAAEAEFVRVWPQWHDAETFDRIGEYFGRGENRGNFR